VFLDGLCIYLERDRLYREYKVPVCVHLGILGKLERGIHGDNLSYYDCLQTVKMVYNKQKMEIKGTQLRYDLIDFKKVVTMTSLTLGEYTVSEPQTFIDGHENNNGTLGY